MVNPWFRLVLILLLCAALAFCAAPWFAFRALRSAAQADDFQALGELIDYDAVRQGLHRQAEDQAAPAPDVWHDPVGALRHAIAPLKPQPALDTLTDPQALTAMTAGLPGKSPDSVLGQLADLVPGQHGRSIRFWDPNRCRIAVKSPDGREALFSFERKGLFAWKLTQLRPPQLADPALTTAPGTPRPAGR